MDKTGHCFFKSFVKVAGLAGVIVKFLHCTYIYLKCAGVVYGLQVSSSKRI